MITSLSIALAGAVHAKRPFFRATCKDEPALPRNVASDASHIEVESTSLRYPKDPRTCLKSRGFTYETMNFSQDFFRT